MAKPYPWLGPGLGVGGLLPAVVIAARAALGTLAADPVAEALNRFGLLALVFLLSALACTPLKAVFGWTWPLRVRRLLGLLAFTHASLHVSLYVAIDQGFAWGAIAEDVATRRFILAGALAFVLLLPLAVTSNTWSVRRLGHPRWQRLHRLAYPAAVFACVHFLWRVKVDLTQPALYGAVLALLLAVRVFFFARRRLAATAK